MSLDTNVAVFLASRLRDKSHKFIVQEFQKRGIEGLVPSHGAIILALYPDIALSMGELSKRIDKDKSTLTTLVNKLLKLGYVDKVQDQKDHRISLIRLTDQSLSLKDDFREISEELSKKMYQDIPEWEQYAVINILKKMTKNF
ncbi:MAG: DNA-binding MarR family transcriptional regulator [bacterium]|jgi:DNA-binding MarR family transcriptional regulator